MYGAPVGSLLVTANGQLVTRTNTTTNVVVIPPVRIFNIHLISGGTASVLTLSNNSDINGVGGTVWVKVTGAINTGSTFDFGINGIAFPKGAFITVDVNIVSATISFRADSF